MALPCPVCIFYFFLFLFSQNNSSYLWLSLYRFIINFADSQIDVVKVVNPVCFFVYIIRLGGTWRTTVNDVVKVVNPVCFFVYIIHLGGTWRTTVNDVVKVVNPVCFFVYIIHLGGTWCVILFTVLSGFVLIIVSIVTFLYPRFSPFFIQLWINIQIGNILAKVETLRITLNIDGAPFASRSHTHPSNSQTSRLLTSSLSLGDPVPHGTQCMWDV